MIRIVETTVGRVLFNEMVPKEVGYLNLILTKKSLREIIGTVLKKCGTAKTAKFLDDIKDLVTTQPLKEVFPLTWKMSLFLLPKKL